MKYNQLLLLALMSVAACSVAADTYVGLTTANEATCRGLSAEEQFDELVQPGCQSSSLGTAQSVDFEADEFCSAVWYDRPNCSGNQVYQLNAKFIGSTDVCAPVEGYLGGADPPEALHGGCRQTSGSRTALYIGLGIAAVLIAGIVLGVAKTYGRTKDTKIEVPAELGQRSLASAPPKYDF